MRLFQRKKIVLCINTQQTLAGIWHGKKLQQQIIFAQNETGLQAFGKFLRQHSLARFYLIFDVADEDYQYQLLPHSTGRTQKTLISRKLAQIYRDFTYKTAIYYGREQTPPKKDIYLFAAVRAEQALHPWLALLQTAACKLVGAYLLSSLSERLLRSSLITQHLQNTKNLLLCERLSSGLRHTYFAHGRLIMSRLLTNLPDTENARLDFYQAEIEKSRLYLISQRLITADMHPDFGVEAASCTASVSSDGYLPWKNLGVEETDGWGVIQTSATSGMPGYWRYRVDSKFATLFKMDTTFSSSELRIINSAGSRITTQAEAPIAIIYSTGKNLRADAENADYEATGGVYQSDVQSKSFDDMLIWVTRPLLMYRMVSAGKLPS